MGLSPHASVVEIHEIPFTVPTHKQFLPSMVNERTSFETNPEAIVYEYIFSLFNLYTPLNVPTHIFPDLSSCNDVHFSPERVFSNTGIASSFNLS
jgi:hypothetical protein